MLVLATAGGRAFSLERPGEAYFVASVLGDLDFVTIHHGGDIGMP
jgi:hypothetical protein